MSLDSEDVAANDRKRKQRNWIWLAVVLIVSPAIYWAWMRDEDRRRSDAIESELDAPPGAYLSHAGTSMVPEWFTEARDLIEKKDYQGAMMIYERVIEREPKNSSAYLGLGSVKLLQNDPVAAKKHLKQALLLEPSSEDIFVALGSAALQEGDPFEAKEWYSKALAKNEKKPSAHYGMALVADQLADGELALQHCNRFLELAPASNLIEVVEHIMARAEEILAKSKLQK